MGVDDPQLARPLPVAFVPRPGVEVAHKGRHNVIVAQVDLNLFLVEDIETKERHQVSLGELTFWEGESVPRRQVPDLATIPQEKIEIGLKRQAAIEGLLKMQYRTRQDVQIVADELGLTASSLYNLMKRYEQEGTWTCLAPHVEKGRPRKKRLDPVVEEIIQQVIDELYFTLNRVPISDVAREVRKRCKRAGLSVAINTVRDRCKAQDARKVMAARHGRKAAKEKYDPKYGPSDEPRWPLQRLEIDHTVADVFVVDEQTGGLPIARPNVTFVIDAFSRCVVGFHLTLRPPSTLSVALALCHAFLPKDDYCRRMQLETPWPICGFPVGLLTDNAAEFDSRGLVLGCRQYGIHGEFRPVGQPKFGGRVERLIGTMMGRIRLMPGATMNSVAERPEDYDPEKHAAYTLAEAEQRLAIEINDRYHRDEHSKLGVSPLSAYQFGILGDDHTPGLGHPRVPTNPKRLLLDFLPLERRSIQDYGIQLEFTRYQAPVLRALQAKGGDRKRHVVRYDPRDMSRVYLYNKEDGEYIEVPRARSYLPPVALWEVRAAIDRLKAKGQDPADEEAVHRAIERMRLMDEDAIYKSKKARKAVEQRRIDAADRQAFVSLPEIPKPVVAPSAAVPTAEAPPEGPAEAPRRIRPISDVEAW